MWEAPVPAKTTVTGADRLYSKASKQRSGSVSRDAQESITMQASKPGVKSKQDIRES